MRVLLTNDDGPPGPESPLILTFYRELRALFPHWSITVAIPNTQRSYISKAFLIKEEIVLSRFFPNPESPDEFWYLLSGKSCIRINTLSPCTLGTPSSCVNIGIHHLAGDQPFDLVLSGPNVGRNTSRTFTLCSGTIGGALEGVLHHKKSIALSFAFYSRADLVDPDKVRFASVEACKVIDCLLKEWPEAVDWYNVNVPLIGCEKYRNGMPSFRTYVAKNHEGSLFDKRNDGEGFKFAPKYSLLSSAADFGSDAWAMQKQVISVTPMLASYAEVGPETRIPILTPAQDTFEKNGIAPFESLEEEE